MPKTDQTDDKLADAPEGVPSEQVQAPEGIAQAEAAPEPAVETVDTEVEPLQSDAQSQNAQNEDGPSAAEDLLAQFKAMLDSELAPIRARLDQIEPKTEDVHGRLRQIEQKIRGFL